MINPTPTTIVPTLLNYVKIFTRFTEFRSGFNDIPRTAWALVSDDPPTEELVNAWVDETKSLIITAETRTDIVHGIDTKIVTQTTTVIYTKAVDYHGREPRPSLTPESSSGFDPGASGGDGPPAGDSDLELVAGQLQSDDPVSPEGGEAPA